MKLQKRDKPYKGTGNSSVTLIKINSILVCIHVELFGK